MAATVSYPDMFSMLDLRTMARYDHLGRDARRELELLERYEPSAGGTGIVHAHSLLSLVQEEVTKRKSLVGLQYMCRDTVEHLLQSIAVAIKTQLDTDTPESTLSLLDTVLGLFAKQTLVKCDNPRSELSADQAKMREIESYFAKCLFNAGIAQPLLKLMVTGSKVKCLFNAGIAQPLLKLMVTGSKVYKSPLAIMVRLVQLLIQSMNGNHLAKQLVAMNCASHLLLATTCAKDEFEYCALYLIEQLLDLEGKPFARQLTHSMITGKGRLPTLMLFWGDAKRSRHVRDLAFSCSNQLLDHLGRPWATHLSSRVSKMLLMLKEQAVCESDVDRKFAKEIMVRMLHLLKVPYATKLKEAGVFDALLGALLDDAKHAIFQQDRVELISVLLRVSKSDPMLHLELASKMALSTLIIHLGSADWVNAASKYATNALRNVIDGFPDDGLARKLVLEGTTESMTALCSVVKCLPRNELVYKVATAPVLSDLLSMGSADAMIVLHSIVKSLPANELAKVATASVIDRIVSMGSKGAIHVLHGIVEGLPADELVRVATTPVINCLVAMGTTVAIRVLSGVVNRSPGDELAHQLIAEGAVPRCVDTLTYTESGDMTKRGKEADILLSTLFAADETQKIKAFLHYAKRDDNCVVTFDKTSPRAYHSLKAAFVAYNEGVLLELEKAFHHSPQQPHYQTLVDVAQRCGETGSPEKVLDQLGHHLRQLGLRILQHVPSPETPLSRQQDRTRRLAKLTACVLTLSKPTTGPRGQLAQFKQLWMPPLMLPFSPEAALTPPGLTSMAHMQPGSVMLLPQALPMSAVASTSSAPPPFMPATPPLLMPPTPPPLNDYLRCRVHPRNDCVKCIVARGPDASVRANFASEGGMGRTRDISLKRACPLADHAISASDDGVPLLEQYEKDYGVKLKVHKKQRFQTFMRDEFSVEPLGKSPSYKVMLYNPPHVNASLAFQGGAVQLNLASFGYEPTSTQGTKDNYMGFQIV